MVPVISSVTLLLSNKCVARKHSLIVCALLGRCAVCSRLPVTYQSPRVNHVANQLIETFMKLKVSPLSLSPSLPLFILPSPLLPPSSHPETINNGSAAGTTASTTALSKSGSKVKFGRTWCFCNWLLSCFKKGEPVVAATSLMNETPPTPEVCGVCGVCEGGGMVCVVCV